MADDGEVISNKPNLHRPKNGTSGVIALPPGSRGPKSLYLKRSGDSFGFTLRHFIVYPPDTVAENDGRHAAVGALSAPMDTIFVKHVKEGGPAKQAGLQCGDRLVGVNRIPVTDKSYAQVVQLIQNSPEYLHLLVVPKEDDILQRFFADTAYNPATNQQVPETDRQEAQQFLTRTISQPREFQLDAVSWKSLQNSYGFDYIPLGFYRTQQSADNLGPRYGDVRYTARAQPQVPQYGRRASDGCALSDRDYYEVPYSGMNNSDEMTLRTALRANYLENGDMRYPNVEGCRLSLDGGRRESSSSLTSSLADGSKDSLSSFDSTSTITGDFDNSAIMSRARRSFQQKEEFLKMPNSALIQREFYSRAKKLDRSMWPPNEQEPKNHKPTHQHFQRVKNDIETERDLLVSQMTPTQQKHRNYVGNLDRIKEAPIAPFSLDYNGGYLIEEDDDEKRYPQMVHKRARQFESGKSLPEDDPLSDRTSFHRSELARISSKRVVPNVNELAQEFETRNTEKRDSSPQKRIQRDSRSLDSSGSNASSASIDELVNSQLSGNVMISSGSKYIHCPPPAEYGQPTDVSEEPAYSMRARSNSADSWMAALHEATKPDAKKRISRLDGTKPKDRTMDAQRHHPYGDLSPLIPEPVEHIHFTPTVSVTPAPTILTIAKKAVRPSQLALDGPIRPARHLKPPAAVGAALMRRSVSPVIGEDNNPVVVKRRTKSTNMADDERITRRESYLKATEGGRMHMDSDISDGDISPQVLRSGSVSSSSSASLDREKTNASPIPKETQVHAIIKEGPLHCKITEIDGKRFGDRSWKQIWASLKGPKLFLHKDKHHQSPMGTSDAVEHSLASGVDMRASVVRVAEDYTKRKHVLRVSSVNPCRAEFLLQAENTEELADWVKALQDQMATTTDVEAKFDPLNNSKQQAVPQANAASTTIQVQGSRLSPQPIKAKSGSRHRSPTGQSPVSKTRKPSQTADPATSPKLKTWRGRMVKQFRKMHGAGSPSSPTAPEGSTFGIPLEQCLMSEINPYVPRFIEVCTNIVDARGLQTVGIYRVPGNNASITALTEEVNRNYDTIPLEDSRWNDLHVVSSLLKSYFRKIPDCLVTSALYSSFIKADKILDSQVRMKELKRLVRSLPPYNYHTLKHLVLHLRRVVDNSDVNKMEAKNLAIVFGPNIVRLEDDNMESMVNNMTHQCKIVETLLSYAEWFFCEDGEEGEPIIVPASEGPEDVEAVNSQILLLDNISKFEALKDKEKNSALLSSLFSAAHRKVKRKGKGGSLTESKEEMASPTRSASYPNSPFEIDDLKDGTSQVDKRNVIPTTVTDMEKNHKQNEKMPWFNYSTDQADFHRRIKNFEQETNAMLQMPRTLEISVNDIVAKPATLSSSASNVSSTQLSTKPADAHLLKTHSASNVFSRTASSDNGRNSVDNAYAMRYPANRNNSDNQNSGSLRYSNNKKYSDANRNVEEQKSAFRNSPNLSERVNGRSVWRRGSSVENVNSVDLNANGTMKKIKYENEDGLIQRVGSLDSLNKIDDDTDLVTSLTKLYDKKLQEEKHSQGNALAGEGLPYVDESPEKLPRPEHILSLTEKENVLFTSDLYRNPSLHKNHLNPKFKWEEGVLKEAKQDIEKDEDSTMTLRVPDNDRPLSLNKLTLTNKKIVLKRSESLNKPEKPLNSAKVKRSESLNKNSDKLKRSDSLTKNEKTESNLNKRRELATSSHRRSKRPKGMPDRSIKRRHTVGGTKDPDKVTWWDNKYQEEATSNKENREKNLRTSSPDLSSSRRERLFFEINLIGPENMVMALKQHLVGARPQSFPETAVFKVPLESHV